VCQREAVEQRNEPDKGRGSEETGPSQVISVFDRAGGRVQT
jgi:hypothetical protein